MQSFLRQTALISCAIGAVIFIGSRSSYGQRVVAELIAVSTESLNTTHQLVGPLGKPLGEVIRVLATVDSKERKGVFEYRLTITNVNGTELSKPIKMPAELFSASPRGYTALTVGQKLDAWAYQDGGMLGCPDRIQRVEAVQEPNYHFSTQLILWRPATSKDK